MFLNLLDAIQPFCWNSERCRLLHSTWSNWLSIHDNGPFSAMFDPLPAECSLRLLCRCGEYARFGYAPSLGYDPSLGYATHLDTPPHCSVWLCPVDHRRVANQTRGHHGISLERYADYRTSKTCLWSLICKDAYLIHGRIFAVIY
jgi:hypothetical protein